MYGAGSAPSFWTPPSGFHGATKPPQYDISYISQGFEGLKDPAYKPGAQYDPYQFTTGKYGKTSAQDLGNVYQQAMGAATRPVRAAGEERMRQATQGWGGGQMSGAAGKELAMKSAAQTGAQVADIGSKVGSDMAGRMLTQDETARQAEFNAQQNMQRDQAAENFKAAGFTDEQAQRMADDILKRMGAMIEGGFGWMDRQRQAGMDEYQKYEDAGFDETWM